jgi:hypothetical protein
LVGVEFAGEGFLEEHCGLFLGFVVVVVVLVSVGWAVLDLRGRYDVGFLLLG